MIDYGAFKSKIRLLSYVMLFPMDAAVWSQIIYIPPTDL
jgi:hypothetical protein